MLYIVSLHRCNNITLLSDMLPTVDVPNWNHSPILMDNCANMLQHRHGNVPIVTHILTLLANTFIIHFIPPCWIIQNVTHNTSLRCVPCYHYFDHHIKKQAFHKRLLWFFLSIVAWQIILRGVHRLIPIVL